MKITPTIFFNDIKPVFPRFKLAFAVFLREFCVSRCLLGRNTSSKGKTEFYFSYERLKSFLRGVDFAKNFYSCFSCFWMRIQQSNLISSKAVWWKYNYSLYKFCILAFQTYKKTIWSCNYFCVSVANKFFKSFLEKRGLIDFIKIGLHSMIKKFSSPKIKIWFEPMFFSGFFYGFERCGSAAFPNFRGGNSPPPQAAKAVRSISRVLP